MKENLGYVIFGLFCLLCSIGMIYRADSLDKKTVDTTGNNTYAVNYQNK